MGKFPGLLSNMNIFATTVAWPRESVIWDCSRNSVLKKQWAKAAWKSWKWHQGIALLLKLPTATARSLLKKIRNYDSDIKMHTGLCSVEGHILSPEPYVSKPQCINLLENCWPKYTWVLCLEVFILVQSECFSKQVSRANEEKGLEDYIMIPVLQFQGHVQTLRSFVDFE